MSVRSLYESGKIHLDRGNHLRAMEDLKKAVAVAVPVSSGDDFSNNNSSKKIFQDRLYRVRALALLANFYCQRNLWNDANIYVSQFLLLSLTSEEKEHLAKDCLVLEECRQKIETAFLSKNH